MIKIKIAEEERLLDRVDEQWINQQINRRRADGQSVCVRVTIEEAGFGIMLSTPTCEPFVGGGAPLNPQERKVIDLWNQRGLNDVGFTGGNLVAFLKQLSRFI